MNREPLDRAIDHVAKRLTHVEDDAQFASRIVAALPDRVTWFGWLLHASAPRLAMIGVAAVAIVLWVASPRFAGQSPQITQITTATQPLTNARPLVTSPELVVAAARASVAQQRTTAIASLQPAPAPEAFDGLPSVASPPALIMSEVTPEALDDTDSLHLPSLVIADLPLTAESFSQRD